MYDLTEIDRTGMGHVSDHPATVNSTPEYMFSQWKMMDKEYYTTHDLPVGFVAMKTSTYHWPDAPRSLLVLFPTELMNRPDFLSYSLEKGKAEGLVLGTLVRMADYQPLPLTRGLTNREEEADWSQGIQFWQHRGKILCDGSGRDPVPFRFPRYKSTYGAITMKNLDNSFVVASPDACVSATLFPFQSEIPVSHLRRGMKVVVDILYTMDRDYAYNNYILPYDCSFRSGRERQLRGKGVIVSIRAAPVLPDTPEVRISNIGWEFALSS